jgi:hypothetical protein
MMNVLVSLNFKVLFLKLRDMFSLIFVKVTASGIRALCLAQSERIFSLLFAYF